MQFHSGKLVRKQFLVSEAHVLKLEQIAEARNTSATDIVRLAIDAFNPDELDTMSSNELMGLVSQSLKEAIASTQQACKKVDDTLQALDT